MGEQDTHTFRVTKKDLDKYSHMNNAVYSRHYGYAERLLVNRGYDSTPSHTLFMPYQTTYMYGAQLKLGDEITITTKYVQKDNLCVYNQIMFSKDKLKNVGWATKKKKNRTNEDLSFDPHLFNVFVSKLLEKGRKGIQGVHGLTSDKLIQKELALVVTSSEIEYLNLNRLIESLKGKELTLESQLEYNGGMELMMHQKVYSQNGHRGGIILTAKSKHLLLDTENDSVCRYLLEKLGGKKILKGGEIPLSKYELDWEYGIENILTQSKEDIKDKNIKFVHPVLLR